MKISTSPLFLSRILHGKHVVHNISLTDQEIPKNDVTKFLYFDVGRSHVSQTFKLNKSFLSQFSGWLITVKLAP